MAKTFFFVSNAPWLRKQIQKNFTVSTNLHWVQNLALKMCINRQGLIAWYAAMPVWIAPEGIYCVIIHRETMESSFIYWLKETSRERLLLKHQIWH
jgi:hypothetical protein